MREEDREDKKSHVQSAVNAVCGGGGALSEAQRPLTSLTSSGSVSEAAARPSVARLDRIPDEEEPARIEKVHTCANIRQKRRKN